MKKLLVFVFALCASLATAQSGQKNFTCPLDKACQTWPLSGLNPSPPAQRGWLKVLFDTKLGRAAYYGGDKRGSVTFSTSWYTYGYSPVTVGSGSPWVPETTCGETSNPFTESYSASDVLAQPITSTTQTSIFLALKRAPYVNPPSNFPVGQTPTMWFDDEEVQYCGFNVTTGELTVGVWNSVNKSCTVDAGQRGIRGTTAATHLVTAASFQGCPTPQTGGFAHNGVLQPANEHIQSRHPWRNMAYDNKRGYWWQMSGKPELYEFTDTWFYDPATGRYVEIPNSKAPGRTDGSLVYDSVNDMLIHFGGSHAGADMDTTAVMCLDDTKSPATLAALGCTSTVGTYSSKNNQTYTWNILSNSQLNCQGTRWDGTNCNTIGGRNQHKGPGPRRTQAFEFDAVNGVSILFGGTNDYVGTLGAAKCHGPDTQVPPFTWSAANCPAEPNDLWAYQAGTRTWMQMHNVGDVPAPTRRPAFAFNSNNGYFALLEGPVNGTPIVGKYEQGMYRLVISLTSQIAQWTLTNFGANGDPEPPLPYSQNDSAPANCQTVGGPLFDQCDHALENMVYDPANRVFMYIDADILVGSSVIQTWQIPEVTVK